MPVCMCVQCDCGGQKTAFDPLDMKLKTVVSFHVCAENRTPVLWNSSQCS